MTIEKLPAETQRDTAPAGGSPTRPAPREGAGHDLAAAPPCRYRETVVLGCVFVPLIGRQGYPR
jgi:hypothetical protein